MNPATILKLSLFLVLLAEVFTKDLPKVACNSDNGEDNLQNRTSYETYSISFTETSHGDEYKPFKISCSLHDKVMDCQSWVNATLLNVSIEVNGTRKDSDFQKKNSTDGKSVIFTDILHYESHDKARFSCVTELPSGARLVSMNKTLSKVDELYNYTITQNRSQITIGESLALTCSTDSIRGMDLRWKVKKDEGNEVTINPPNGKEAGLTYTIKESRENLSSVLNITTENDGKLKSRIDYTFTCTVKHPQHSSQGIAKTTVTVLPVDHSLKNGLITAGVIVLVLTIVLTGLFLWRRRRNRRNLAVSIRMTETRNALMERARQTSMENGEERRATDALMMAIDSVNSIMDRISKRHSAWEKDKSMIQIKEKIGEGNFGFVLLGLMPNEYGIIQHVAIKTIKEQGIDVPALLDFEKEMEVMVSLQHRNVVALMGICTTSLPFYIIMEYMENGQLDKYLTQFAPTRGGLGRLSVGQLAWICQQPCDALEYLTSNNMVHRDVSARNCLVGQNLVVKLADFGLSRDTSGNNYYKKEGGMVPIKWMAPEALTYGRYTSANDVWAFGVLAWEVFSYGALPYQHLSNQQVMVNICKGERLDRPHICPEGLWEVLLKCWADNPDERIVFTSLLAFLKDYSEETTSFPHSDKLPLSEETTSIPVQRNDEEFPLPDGNTAVAF